MVRTPCCEEMGLKKGPWTPEEDQILISHIQRFGHGNWRALPKQAGLLRCGKSCRLRWINYLRPDIKRGKFSKEEVETILKLHGVLGNRWSAIAARLPGRTDNEIKNFWHTHLKKRGGGQVHTSSCPLQETQATSSSGTLDVPRVAVDASVATSTVGIGPVGFYGTGSTDISGDITGSNAYNETGEEMDFWYNLLISSHHKGMEI